MAKARAGKLSPNTGIERAYQSVEYISREQWFHAGVMRSFHRYASDLMVVMVVVHLSTFTRVGYRIGFRSGREWREVFNSDVYSNRVNPHVAADSGRVVAEPHPMHDFSYSATLVLPADSLLVFAR